MAAKKKSENEQQENLTLEEAFVRIEEKIKAMEGGDLSLEEAFAGYEEGMNLLKYCNEQIDLVEKKVQKISEDGSEEDFES